MWVFIVPLVVGIGSGFSIGRYASSMQDSSEDLKSEIARLQEQPSGYRRQVRQHFVETADVINAMTANYRDLYDHLSKASQELGGKQSHDIADSDQRFVEHTAADDAERRAAGDTDEPAEAFAGDDRAAEHRPGGGAAHEAEQADQAAGERTREEPPEERGKNDNTHPA